MPTVGNRLLREAIERIGIEQVALHLKLPLTAIALYRGGHRPVDDSLMLRVIDLLDNTLPNANK